MKQKKIVRLLNGTANKKISLRIIEKADIFVVHFAPFSSAGSLFAHTMMRLSSSEPSSVTGKHSLSRRENLFARGGQKAKKERGGEKRNLLGYLVYGVIVLIFFRVVFFLSFCFSPFLGK